MGFDKSKCGACCFEFVCNSDGRFIGGCAPYPQVRAFAKMAETMLAASKLSVLSFVSDCNAAGQHHYVVRCRCEFDPSNVRNCALQLATDIPQLELTFEFKPCFQIVRSRA